MNDIPVEEIVIDRPKVKISGALEEEMKIVFSQRQNDFDERDIEAIPQKLKELALCFGVSDSEKEFLELIEDEDDEIILVGDLLEICK